MRSRLIEKEINSGLTISTAQTTAWIDVTGVGGTGGDSIAFVLTVSSASTPGTASISLQGSLDKTDYVVVGSAVNVTTNATLSLTQDRPPFRYYRVAYAIASGSYVSKLKVLVKGD